MPLRGSPSENARIRVYLGPMEYSRLREYGRDLDRMIYLGPTWGIRQIAEYLMIPLFNFLRSFIPNYGVVIIIFSIILKFALHPLTKSSMVSMRKMQKLQPMLTEMREKYKDDQEKIGREQMKLYGEYGINPAVVKTVATELEEIKALGVQVAIVIGGGNIYRGVAAR